MLRGSKEWCVRAQGQNASTAGAKSRHSWQTGRNWQRRLTGGPGAVPAAHLGGAAHQLQHLAVLQLALRPKRYHSSGGAIALRAAAALPAAPAVHLHLALGDAHGCRGAAGLSGAGAGRGRRCDQEPVCCASYADLRVAGCERATTRPACESIEPLQGYTEAAPAGGRAPPAHLPCSCADPPLRGSDACVRS